MVRVLLRADGSSRMGTGHVMRCLTLAENLTERGVVCDLVLRDLPGHPGDRVLDKGLALHLLPAPVSDQGFGTTPHARWQNVDPEEDAAQTIAAVPEPDWIVVDHYGLDATWQAAVLARCPSAKILVIDDLADRPHLATLLLDQSYGRGISDYAPRVQAKTKCLLGPEFALLRPEFATLRETSLQRREVDDVGRCLITLGGGECSDAILTLLSGPLEVLPKDCAVTLVLGGEQERDAEIRKAVKSVDVIDYADNMPELMAEADICIGAGGTSAWERCCLGLPTVMLILADNQQHVAHGLQKAGAAYVADWRNPKSLRDSISKTVKQRRAVSRAAAGITAGDGAERVANEMKIGVTLRSVELADASFLHACRYAGNAAQYYRSVDVPEMSSHVAWLEPALLVGKTELLIAEEAGQPVAHGRLDHKGDQTEISLYLAEDARGRGLGKILLRSLVMRAKKTGSQVLVADVHRDNPASARVFEACGFQQNLGDAPFLRYSLVQKESINDG